MRKIAENARDAWRIHTYSDGGCCWYLISFFLFLSKNIDVNFFPIQVYFTTFATCNPCLVLSDKALSLCWFVSSKCTFFPKRTSKGQDRVIQIKTKNRWCKGSVQRKTEKCYNVWFLGNCQLTLSEEPWWFSGSCSWPTSLCSRVCCRWRWRTFHSWPGWLEWPHSTCKKLSSPRPRIGRQSCIESHRGPRLKKGKTEL